MHFSKWGIYVSVSLQQYAFDCKFVIYLIPMSNFSFLLPNFLKKFAVGTFISMRLCTVQGHILYFKLSYCLHFQLRKPAEPRSPTTALTFRVRVTLQPTTQSGLAKWRWSNATAIFAKWGRNIFHCVETLLLVQWTENTGPCRLWFYLDILTSWNSIRNLLLNEHTKPSL